MILSTRNDVFCCSSSFSSSDNDDSNTRLERSTVATAKTHTSSYGGCSVADWNLKYHNDIQTFNKCSYCAVVVCDGVILLLIIIIIIVLYEAVTRRRGRRRYYNNNIILLKYIISRRDTLRRRDPRGAFRAMTADRVLILDGRRRARASSRHGRVRIVYDCRKNYSPAYRWEFRRKHFFGKFTYIFLVVYNVFD